LFKKAHKRGHAVATCILADYYFDGDPVLCEKSTFKPNFRRASDYYRKSADAGYVTAMCGMGRIFEKKNNRKQTLAWHCRTAELGYCLGQYNAGVI